MRESIEDYLSLASRLTATYPRARASARARARVRTRALPNSVSQFLPSSSSSFFFFPHSSSSSSLDFIFRSTLNFVVRENDFLSFCYNDQ